MMILQIFPLFVRPISVVQSVGVSRFPNLPTDCCVFAHAFQPKPRCPFSPLLCVSLRHCFCVLVLVFAVFSNSLPHNKFTQLIIIAQKNIAFLRVAIFYWFGWREMIFCKKKKMLSIAMNMVVIWRVFIVLKLYANRFVFFQNMNGSRFLALFATIQIVFIAVVFIGELQNFRTVKR